MRNKEEKTNQITRHLTMFISFAIFCVIVVWGVNVTSQSRERPDNKIVVEQSMDDLQGSDEETQQLIEVLKKRDKSIEVIFAAIKTLGDKKAKEAIPELIKYLDYEKVYAYKQPEYAGSVKIDGTEIGRTIPLEGRYPATGALFQIGKSSLPALIKVIEAEKLESLKSQNALYTIRFIFRDDSSEAVEYLERAMKNSTTQEGQQRLLDVIEKTKKERLRIQNLKLN